MAWIRRSAKVWSLRLFAFRKLALVKVLGL
jgi:hypothetical protein